jgi:hypothetical protein
MSYFLYNAAPGRMYFLGNEITAEPAHWTEVSEYSVNHGTFNSMRRMKMVYLVEADARPTYDPTHPDNKARVEREAPGAAADRKSKLDDGSMTEAELKAFLAAKNATKVDKVHVSTLSGKTEAITAESLADIGQAPTTFNPPADDPISGPAAETQTETESGIKTETLGETVPFIKEAAAKKPKAAKKAEAITPPADTGAWS